MKEITQGEWKFIRYENNFEIEVFGVNNWIIAQTITNLKQDEANAKLIACAPEMLAQLETLHSFYEDLAMKINSDDFDEEFRSKWNPIMTKTELLIKKATE